MYGTQITKLSSVNRSQIKDILSFKSPICPLIEEPTTTVWTTFGHPEKQCYKLFITNYLRRAIFCFIPLLLAILEPAPPSGVSRMHEMSYGDAMLETGRRLMAILELSLHAVMAQGVANNLHYAHPGLHVGLKRFLGFMWSLA